MADITTAVNKFLSSELGADVRDGLATALNSVNTDAIAISGNYANVLAAAGNVSAVSASTSATNASTSATNASASATNASTSATTASTSASLASASATNASASATNASTSAATATTKAAEASTSATNASASATTASTSAATSTTKAAEASTSAANIAPTETIRVTAESNRVTAESNRVSTETGRTTSESNRVVAETGRVSAESNRVTAFSGMIHVDANLDLSTAHGTYSDLSTRIINEEQGILSNITYNALLEQYAKYSALEDENNKPLYIPVTLGGPNVLLSVAIPILRNNINYSVAVEISTVTGTPSGDIIIITNKQANGFTISHTGSTTAMTVICTITGGMI